MKCPIPSSIGLSELEVIKIERSLYIDTLLPIIYIMLNRVSVY